MKLPSAPWQDWAGMKQLLAALGSGDGETRYVGGCVRDRFLGLEVSDVDVATRLPPETVIERLRKAGIKPVPTGIDHGTVTAVLRDHTVEVTTLRRDVATDGRRATIAYTGDWKEDAARRDFTINALSVDPASLEIFDYFGGLEDLEARRVRFIGDPLVRIAEDHLRILRFFRFYARFGEEPDPASLDACAARANDLMALSRERIADELLKLLALPDPTATVALMIERGIFRPVLPEIDKEGCDRLGHLVARERMTGIKVEPVRRLAALLPPDPATADDIASRLRLSNDKRRRLTLAADRENWRGGSAFQRSYGIGWEAAVDRLLLGDDSRDLVKEQYQVLTQRPAPRLIVKGSDLIAMGLPKGPIVSKTLLAIGQQWLEEDFPGDDRIWEIARRHVDQARRDSQ